MLLSCQHIPTNSCCQTNEVSIEIEHYDMYMYIEINTYYHNTCTSEFLISSYGTPLAQRASYLALHSSLFGPDGAVNYDYIITNSINSLLIRSRCIPNGTH